MLFTADLGAGSACSCVCVGLRTYTASILVTTNLARFASSPRTPSPRVIARYVNQELRNLQSRKMGMPSVSTATLDGINQVNHFVMVQLTQVRINTVDDLRDSLIERSS